MRLPVRVFFSTASLGILFAFSGCGEEYPSAATGGTGTSPAGAASTGGNATGGTAVASGGNVSTGGLPANGGLANGGVSGALTNSGGSPSTTGGTSFGTGGASFGTGGTSFGTGGASGGTNAGSGGTSPIGKGGAGGTAGTANGGVAGGGRSGGASGGPSGGQGGAGKGGASQGGATTSGGADAISFAVAENIIGNNCAGCHVSRQPIFTTSGTTLYKTLTSTAVKECGNHKLVVPGDPTNSAIIELVTNKCNGYKMPTSCSDPVCLVADDLSRLTNWISQGAKNP